MTLGFPAELTKLELSEGFRTSFMGPMTRIPPTYVNDGPIFENVMTGDGVDVTRFPAPKWHSGDGGRYIGTGTLQRHPRSGRGWINCGTYRVHDPRRQDRGLLHLARQARPPDAGTSTRQRGERMPVRRGLRRRSP